MKFYIKYYGEQQLIELDPNDTIETVKLYLKLHFQIPPNEQILTHPSTRDVLRDDHRLSYYFGPENPMFVMPHAILLSRISKNQGKVLAKSQEIGDFGKQANMVTGQMPSGSNNSLHSLSFRIMELEETLALERKERHNQVDILTKEKNEALGELSRVTTCFKEINTASEALLTSKDKQLEEAIKLNAELQKEIEILNETMAALPTRLEADIGIEDTRVIELEAENLGFKQKFGAQEKKFQEEIQKLNSILESENIEKKELTAKLAEAKANILSLANVVKKQEGEIDELKKLLEVKEKEYEESIQKIQENQTKMTQQINSLKSKWRSEAKRNFHESMAYVQKNYKQMLAVEDLGFLKSSDDFTPMNMSISMSMNHAPSAMSVMTSSSSYEKIDEGSTQDLTGSQFWSVPEESEEIKQSE